MPASPKTPSGSGLNSRAKAFGFPALIPLTGEPTPDHLDYLDLLPAKVESPLRPDAVAEFQGRPVMYMVDGGAQTGRQQASLEAIHELQQLLANRSEQACLGIVWPGSLEVYPINLDRKTLAKTKPQIITEAAPEAPTFFQSLATGALALKGQPKEADFVFHEIHRLLQRASEALTGKLAPLEVLSTTGRALFFRFLLDRRIVLPAELNEICPEAANLKVKDSFSNAENAAATSCWLDETFNGDLLPLVAALPADLPPEDRHRTYLEFYRRAGADTQQSVFLHLQAILRGWESVPGANFQLRIDWDDLNFAHIPIGVLSQVYETFSRQLDEEHAEKTSVYYTPKNIARCLVEEAFAGLKDPAEAQVLDPACGAGIFLVLAFRRLVRARWEKDEQRPDTRTIQRILYSQLKGFDVSESALRLAALALYITAIEVNGSPRPPKSLKFPRPLKNHVLFNFRQHGAGGERGFVFGSLGPEVPQRFNGVFDVVVTNPPWTRHRVSNKADEDAVAEKARLEALNQEYTNITQRVLKARKLEDIGAGYTNPDNNPDLPFVWRAAEWAKPGGIIAMTLPGRILFKQSEQGKAARAALMRGLSVTGIINASNLPETAVWPKMKQPFMLFFARNAVAEPNHQFYFATPVRERKLNDRGLFRIDYQAAEPVSAQTVVEKPWLLKALALGSALDVEVMDSLMALQWRSVGELWRRLGLYSGLGYNLSPGLAQSSADPLVHLLDFREPETGFQIDYAKLVTWHENHNRNTAHMPRSERLYQAPLLIVSQSPGEGRESPKSYLSATRSLCFSQSYYGFSAVGHSDAEVLVALLYLITHSLLFNYFCLMVSSRLGAERRTFIKVDLEAFPFPDPAKLVSAQKRRILSLAEGLETRRDKPWDALDGFVFELYGLDDDEVTVVRDTLAVGAPYQSVRGPAELPPSLEEARGFCSYLEDMIQPSFEVVGQRVSVEMLPAAEGEWSPPWRFVSVALKGDRLPASDALLIGLMEEANRVAASRVVMRVPDGGLLIGILNQRRFWTQSRARLCGLHITRQCLDAFPVEMKS
jgi:hypothetical protein